MVNKRIAWLTIVLLLFFMAYVYDNASVGNTDDFINQKIWIPLHSVNQYVSFGLLVISVLILLIQLIAVIKKEKVKEEPKKDALSDLFG